MAVPRSCIRRIVGFNVQHTRQYSAPAERAIPPNKAKYVPSEGTYPAGFWVGSAHAQVKASNTKYDDMALIASDRPCSGAAVFTQNAFKAAPVLVCKRIAHESRGVGIRGVVINSGCANAVTGQGGFEDAVKMAKQTDDALVDRFQPGQKSHPDHLKTLVMSTGVIGQRLPIDRITDKIPHLVDSLGTSHDHWLRTARAICTTDTFPKLLSRQFTLPSHPGVTFSMAGMTKGAGMIHPNMATLLGVICTDAPVDNYALVALLRSATARSFNRITVDGDTSTNDTVALLANGSAVAPGTEPIRLMSQLRLDKDLMSGVDLEKQSQDYKALLVHLQAFMEDLAKLIVRDGEGATKFVTIRVQNAINNVVAQKVAMSIAQSALVKTALYGKDANWGRILCAIGYTDEAASSIKPRQTSVSFKPADGSEELKLLVNGEPEQVDETRAKAILDMEDLEILVTMSDESQQPEGSVPKLGNAVVYTCDFSHEYVTINGDYRT